MTKLDLLFDIADLMSFEGENPEYDRACIEIALRISNYDFYDHEDMFSFLRFLKFGDLKTSV